MSNVNMSMWFPVPIDQVWRLIGGFSTLPNWCPAVEKSDMEDGGRVRRLQLVGGGAIVERLESFNENEHQYTYTIEQGPLPVANYKATVRVRTEPGKSGSTVEWSSQFLPSGATEKDAVAAIQSFYQTGFDNLKKLFGV